MTTLFCLRQKVLSRNMLQRVAKSKILLYPSTKVICVYKRHLSKNTVDEVDLKNLSKIASKWWDPEGPLKPLHSFNVIRVPFIRDSLVITNPNTPQSTCLLGKKILDVGCGTGILTEDLAKLGAELTGIDPSKELVDVAIEHSANNARLANNQPTYINTTIEEHIMEHSNEYDAVVASEVIEHINHTQREFFIESCVKALKPGGKIIISTPNRTRLSQFFVIFLTEGLNIVPKGTHQYYKFSTQAELKYWLELNDCHVDLTRGNLYYFWSNEWTWTKLEAMMYFIRAVKLDKSA